MKKKLLTMTLIMGFLACASTSFADKSSHFSGSFRRTALSRIAAKQVDAKNKDAIQVAAVTAGANK